MERQVSISNAVTKNFGQQIAFLRRLIMAKSANPFTPETSSPDTPVEKEVASVIHQELHRLAFRAESMGYTLQRPNVVSILPGSWKSEKTLVHTTHMDTVEPSDYTRDP